MVLVARGCCAGDDSWVRAFFADRGCLIGRATDSSSSDACGDCRFPLDRVVCLVTRLVTASGSSLCASATACTGAKTDSSSSDACRDCPFPLDRVVCLVTRLVTTSGSSMCASATARTGAENSSTERDDLVSSLVDLEVDFLFAEVAEDGFRAEARAMITDFGSRNVWGCLCYYGDLGRLNQ